MDTTALNLQATILFPHTFDAHLKSLWRRLLKSSSLIKIFWVKIFRVQSLLGELILEFLKLRFLNLIRNVMF